MTEWQANEAMAIRAQQRAARITHATQQRDMNAQQRARLRRRVSWFQKLARALAFA